MNQGLIIDLFAGAGGASRGIRAAIGREPNYALNHDPIAISVHRANHPGTVHRIADIRAVDPLEITLGAFVWLLWASIDCTHFSCAKGGKPLDHGLRSLAWEVIRWAKKVSPSIIILENVAEFLGWGPLDENGKPRKKEMGDTFRKWLRALKKLGYVVEYKILVASHYGTPTSRKRLFLVARRDGLPIMWPAATHGPGLTPFRTAAECIDWSLAVPSIFEREKPLKPATLKRIARGVDRFVINNPNPFIINIEQGLMAPVLIQTSYGERTGQAPRVLDLHQPLGTIVAQGTKHSLAAAFLAKHYTGVTGQELKKPIGTITAIDHHSVVVSFLTAYYGEDAGQSLSDPLRTITTKDRMGLVTVAGVDYKITDIGMRMLQPHELLAAQFGKYAASYDLGEAVTKKNKVRLIGNSVPPEMAEAVVRSNLRGAA